MYLINGQWQDALPANDRAIQFGDGCFTTACVIDGSVRFQADHLRRLQQACEALMIEPVDWHRLNDEMSRLAASETKAVLKVIISRGAGGRGYSASGCMQPTRILSLSSYPAFYAAWREQGITLALSPVKIGVNPSLAGVKHLNRLEQVLIRTHLERTAAQEALVLDSQGSLVECCAANLFWRKGQDVYTPRIDGAGVNGTMRQRIIACLSGSPWRLHEVSEGPETLANADEVIICNALMPIVPVNQAQDWRYTSRDLHRFLAPLCE